MPRENEKENCYEAYKIHERKKTEKEKDGFGEKETQGKREY